MRAFSRIKPEWISLFITVMVVIIPGQAAGAVALNDDQKLISPHINQMSAIQHISLFSAAASQRIEIETPPGRGGIEPTLALVYNSHNSAGSMGIGWCIDAGAIERSTRHGLDYTKNEYAVSKDGSKIELVSRGVWYGKKSDNDFTRYFFLGEHEGWMAATREGIKYFYGSDQGSESRQINADSRVFRWRLDRVEDPNGNYMIFEYTRTPDSAQDQGQIYLHRIKYTGNPNGPVTQPKNRVDFFYEDRGDIRSSRSMGSSVVTAKRLKQIKAYGNGILAKTVILEYEEGSSSGRSRLVRIKEDQRPPVQISWQEGGNGSFDFNGGIVPPSQAGCPEYGQGASHFFVDVDKDGFSDIVSYWRIEGPDMTPACGFRTYLSDRNGSFGGCIKTTYTDIAPGAVRFGEINGDGKTDIIGDSCYFLSNGDGTFSDPVDYSIPACNAWGDRLHRFFVDLNGDGLSDLLRYSWVDNPLSGIWIALHANLSNGDGTFQACRGELISIENEDFTPDAVRLGEINGDGLTDLLMLSGFYLLSNGDGSFSGIMTSQLEDECIASIYKEGEMQFFHDVNSDGLSDIVNYLWNDESGEAAIQTRLSNGDGTFRPCVESTGTGLVSGSIRFGEIDGDGLTDIVVVSNGLPYHCFLNSGPYPDLLATVDNGYGATVTYDYLPSTQYDNVFLPTIVQTIHSIGIDDGIQAAPAVTIFDYGDGFYEEKEFRGFGRVTQTNPNSATVNGTVVETLFHQDRFRKGKPKSLEFKNSQHQLLKRIAYTWEPSDPESLPRDSWAHVRLQQEQMSLYDDNRTPPSAYKKTVYTYNDIHGSMETRTSTGTNGEGITLSYEFANHDVYLWRVSREKITGSTGKVLRMTDYDYDFFTGNLRQKKIYNDLGPDPASLYDHDAYGNLTHTYDPETNRPVEIQYDAATHSFPVKTIFPDTGGIEHIVETAYDYRFGTVKTWIDENKNSTNRAFDNSGRLVRVSYPDGGWTSIDYSNYDNTDVLPRFIRTQTRENYLGATLDIFQFYDGLGRQIGSIKKGENGKPVVLRKQYDVLGRVKKIEGPFFGTNFDINQAHPPSYPFEITSYDDFGRPVDIRSPINDSITSDGSSWVIARYAYQGFETLVADPDSRKTRQTKDYLGRIIRIIEDDGGLGYRTEYAYNGVDDLLGIKKYNGNDMIYETAIVYDSLGNKIRTEDPDAGLWNYSYDKAGNLKTMTDARGHITTYTYDDLHRLTSRTYSAADNSALYFYDRAASGIGLLYQTCIDSDSDQTCSSGETTTTRNAYDKMGRIKRVTKAIDTMEFGTYFEYDLSGKITSMTYPDPDEPDHLGSALFFEYYQGTNLLKKIKANPFTYFVRFESYEPFGRAGQVYYGNGITSKTSTYDSESARLIRYRTIRNTVGGPVDLQDRAYRYSPAGDITEIRDLLPDGRSYVYEYDSLHRLLKETVDGSGLVTQVTTVTNSHGHIHDTDGPLHAFRNSVLECNGATTEFPFHPDNFDSNGNMINTPDLSVPSDPATRSIKYNSENMPSVIAHSKHGTTTFEYDADGNRVKKSHGGGVHYYIGPHYEVVNGRQTSFIFAENTRIAMISGSDIKYFHKDHLGSTHMVTSGDGVPAASHPSEYMPFGLERDTGGQTVSPYKFTDQEEDIETGLYNFNARLYDPGMGMFISPDRILPDVYNPQSFNKFAYCRNNPLIYVDPTGHAEYLVHWTTESVSVPLAGAIGYGGARIEGVAISLSPNENSNHDAVEFKGFFNGPSMGLPYGITNSSEIFEDPHEIADVERIAGNALYLSGTAALHFGLSGGGYKFGQLIGINENASIIKGWDLGLDLMLGETALDGAAYEVTDPYDLTTEQAGGPASGPGDKGDDNPGPKRDGHGNVIGM